MKVFSNIFPGNYQILIDRTIELIMNYELGIKNCGIFLRKMIEIVALRHLLF